MATWHFQLALIPAEQREDPREFHHHGKAGAAGRAKAPWSARQPDLTVVDDYLSRGESWSSNLRAWHSEEGHEIWALSEGVRGDVLETGAKIDLRASIDSVVRFVGVLCAVAGRLDAKLWIPPDGPTMLPIPDDVLDAANRSFAAWFVKDPVAALRSLEGKKMSDP